MSSIWINTPKGIRTAIEEVTRWRNPIKWIKDKLKNKCVCENLKCECCFKLKLFSKKVCLSSEQLSDEKQLKIVFKLNDVDLVNKLFNINRSDSVCGTVPAPLNFLKFCFSQDTEARSDNVISSCSNVDFRVLGSVGAVIQFKCLEFSGGKLTFGGYSKIKKEGMFTLKAKNPFKAAVAMYKSKGKN